MSRSTLRSATADQSSNGVDLSSNGRVAVRRTVARKTAAGKAEHHRINVDEDVSARIDAGFGRYRFLHNALPEVNLEQVSCATTLLGKSLAAPVLISCMTGGTPDAGVINRCLAEAAAELGVALGLGSGRALLEDPGSEPSFQVRSHAPEIPLLANLGAVQLNRGIGIDSCRRFLECLGADALVLHLNPLQEALESDGDTCFGGLLERIAGLCARLERPVIVKEVGWGMAPDIVQALFAAGVHAIDVAGAGGTSWSEVERHRLADPAYRRIAAAFAGWGIPTVDSLREARRVAPDGLVFASGGIRDGIDAAKAVALGADLVGLAGPFLRAAVGGTAGAIAFGDELITTLRLAMFCVGAGSLAQLRGTSRLMRADERQRQPHVETLYYETEHGGQFLDITDDVRAVVSRSGVRDGNVLVFTNHTTTAIRINENEPLLLEDFRGFLDRIAPAGGYLHDDMSRRVGVPSDEPVNGHAHCRQLLLSSSETIPIARGMLKLGTWQRIFLIELCSLRSRCVTVQVLG
jgi:isopentenyl-diphosphate delta-isomerase